jgi:hypothetical protein
MFVCFVKYSSVIILIYYKQLVLLWTTQHIDLRIKKLKIKTLRIKTLRIKTFSITTLS